MIFTIFQKSMKNLFIKHYIKLDIIHDNLYKKTVQFCTIIFYTEEIQQFVSNLLYQWLIDTTIFS